MTAVVPRGMTVDAHIYLTIVGPGLYIQEDDGFSGFVGGAAAGISGYKYLDENNNTQEVVFDHWIHSLRIEKCVEITFALVSRYCWAKADGMIFHWQ